MTVQLLKGSDGRWGLRFPFHLKDRVKAIPGMMWDTTLRLWVGRPDAIELALVELGQVVPDELRAAKKVGAPFVPVAEKGLRDYQKEGVRFLLDRKRALLADDMGLGKTCTSLTAARALNSRTLVVCPNYVKGVWVAELAKWWPKAKVEVLATTKSYAPGDPDVCIIHYDILHAWADDLELWNPRVVIPDECHALMSEDSQRSKAMRQVCAGVECVWGLTGTPMTNRPRDLWNVCDVIRPGTFGKFFSFGLRYCDAHQEQVTPIKSVWKFEGQSNLEELNARLRWFMLRRLKHEVSLELPTKTRQIVSVEVPVKARVMPNASAKALRESLNKAADFKLEPACEIVRSALEEGHKVVCFTWRRDVAEHIANSIRELQMTAEIIHGGVSTLKRGAAIERAKRAPVSVLCATIDAASVGIDLSYADVCVFAELDYKPHALLQAEARLHRFGQKNPVLIKYVIASGTTDEIIASKVIGKLDVFEKAIGKTGEGLAESLRGDDEDLLAELYEAIEKEKRR